MRLERQLLNSTTKLNNFNVTSVNWYSSRRVNLLVFFKPVFNFPVLLHYACETFFPISREKSGALYGDSAQWCSLLIWKIKNENCYLPQNIFHGSAIREMWHN